MKHIIDRPLRANLHTSSLERGSYLVNLRKKITRNLNQFISRQELIDIELPHISDYLRYHFPVGYCNGRWVVMWPLKLVLLNQNIDWKIALGLQSKEIETFEDHNNGSMIYPKDYVITFVPRDYYNESFFEPVLEKILDNLMKKFPPIFGPDMTGFIDDIMGRMISISVGAGSGTVFGGITSGTSGLTEDEISYYSESDLTNVEVNGVGGMGYSLIVCVGNSCIIVGSPPFDPNIYDKRMMLAYTLSKMVKRIQKKIIDSSERLISSGYLVNDTGNYYSNQLLSY